MIETAPKKSSTLLVLEACEDLHAAEQVVTRETLADQTGLKLSVVDDRLCALVDDGKIHRVQRGVFVPAETHPPARPISKTILPGGIVKIEIGDQVLELTPRENRALAELQAGAAAAFAAIEGGHQAAVLASELSVQVRKLSRELAALREEKDPAQRDLIEQGCL